MRIAIILLLTAVASCAYAQDNQKISGRVTANLAKRYDSVRSFYGGFAAVSANGRWGFVNRTGAEIIPTIYRQVSDFVENRAAALSTTWILIDSNGVYTAASNFRQAERFTHRIQTATRPVETASSGFLAASEPCPPNIDFEFGNFMNWYCFTGRVITAGGVNTIVMFNNNPPVNAPFPGRHTMLTSSIPGATDPYGGFSLNPPNGSGHAIRLGNDDVLDSAERVRYIIQVPLNAPDFSVTLQYAVVLENPSVSQAHTQDEKPRMTVEIKNPATGAVVQCCDFLFVAAGTIPGFFNSAIDPNVKCKSWTPVFINLSAYAGQTLYLDVTTADCTLGAHFGYGYVDVGPCSQTLTVDRSCVAPNVTTLTAPPGFQSYAWWDAGYTTQLGTSQTLVLNPGPPVGTQYHVQIVPFNGISCTDTLDAVVTIPAVAVDAGPDRGVCPGGTATIGTATVPGYSYQWSPATFLSNPNIAQPVATVSQPIRYILNITDANGCPGADTIDLTMLSKPAASFDIVGGPQCVSANNFQFQNTSAFPSGTFTASWDFGDGGTSSALHGAHTYSAAGTYSVTLTITGNNGCIDVISHPVQVLEKPLPVFQPSAPAQCLNGNVFNFQNNSTIGNGSLSYFWTFGDGGSSTGTSPSHSYTTPGSFTVKLVATSSAGCRDSTTTVVTVHSMPVASFSVPIPAQCVNAGSFQFQQGSTVAGTPVYAWDFGDGNTSALSNPTHVYASPGNYVVSLIVSGTGGCSASTTRPVTVHPKPSVQFTAQSISECLPLNNFSTINNSQISPGSLSYLWTFGDGFSSVAVAPSHSYAAAGGYTIKLLAISNNNCRDSMSVPVTVRGKPPVSVAANANPLICSGNSTSLSATGAASYQWAPSAGLDCTTCPNPNANPSANATYVVTGTDTYGCFNTDTVRIKVMQPFRISASNASVCSGKSVSLLAGGAATYTWSPATGLSSSTTANPAASPLSTTTYTVIGTDSASCFKDTAYSTVTVKPSPTLELGNDLTLATGDQYSFNPVISNGPMTSWNWSPITGLSCSTCPQPVLTVGRDAEYQATITNIHGCSATDLIRIITFCHDAQVYFPNAFTPDGDGVNDFHDPRKRNYQSALFQNFQPLG